MIVLDIACDRGHRFEGWFASAEAFASQCERQLVACPSCGSTAVIRQPSAPYVVTSRPTSSAPQQRDPALLARQLAAGLRAMAANAQDVGRRFPDEARRIHYGESELQSVRGQASRDELESLIDEGIGILPVPPDDDLH